MPLHQFVDFFPYCNELSEITGLSIDVVIKIVEEAFTEIQEGKLNSVTGFKKIEEQLGNEMYYRSFFITTSMEEPKKQKLVCNF